MEYLDTIRVKTQNGWKTIQRFRNYFSGKMEIVEITISEYKNEEIKQPNRML